MMNNGLLAQAQPQTQDQQQPSFPPGGNDQPQQDQPGLSDAQVQQETEKYLILAKDVLYSPQMKKSIMKMLRGDRPEIVVPKLAAQLVAIVDEKSQGAIPEEVVLPLGVHILGEVEDFATRIGKGIPQDQMDDAMAVMIQELMQHYGTTQEEVDAYIQSDPEAQQQLVQTAQGG